VNAISTVAIQTCLDESDLSEARLEQELVQACQAGDHQAFRQLYKTHRTDVRWTIIHFIGSSGEIEDLIQDVFLEIYKSIHRFEGRSKLATWIRRLTVNVTLQHIRKKQRRVQWCSQDRMEQRNAQKPWNTPHEAAETQDRVKVVNRALDSLTPEKRSVLVMHDMQGLTGTQISELLGKSILTVRTRLFYARREFYRKILSSSAFEGDISPNQLRTDRSKNRKSSNAQAAMC
jgi:RNA polymerase sigma-70 factor (ECF subfamily)